MTLQLNFPPQLAERLRQEAARQGQTSEAMALSLLDQHLPPLDERRAAAIALLHQWMEEDSPTVGADGDDEFFRDLDASRTSNRPLFPPELKGITW
jgi:hypothetical protein